MDLIISFGNNFSPCKIVQDRLLTLGLPKNNPTPSQIQTRFNQEAQEIETFFDGTMSAAIRQVRESIENTGSFPNGSAIDHTEIVTGTSSSDLSALEAKVTAKIDGFRGPTIDEVNEANLARINTWSVFIGSRRVDNRSDNPSLPDVTLEQNEYGGKYLLYADPKNRCILKYYSRLPGNIRISGPKIGAPLIQATVEKEGTEHAVWLTETAYKDVVYV